MFDFKNIIGKTGDFSKYLLAEFTDFLTYINAFLIGVIINYFSGFGFPGSITAYIIPIFVQVISKAMVKYNNRHLRRLIQLPAEREDPVFIMGASGDILLSSGITSDVFNKYNIDNIKSFIGEDGYYKIKNDFNIKDSLIEVYSHQTDYWYEVKIKPIKSVLPVDKREYLIWFIDITSKKNYEIKLSNVLKFSSELNSSLTTKIDENYIYDSFANFILTNGYSGIYMAIKIKKNEIFGFTYKIENEKLVRSKLIEIDGNVSASLLNYENIIGTISSDVKDFDRSEDFYEEFQFHNEITSFLLCTINNFVYFHDEKLTITAFNKNDKNSEITKYDRLLLEVVVHYAKNLLSLVRVIKKTVKSKN